MIKVVIKILQGNAFTQTVQGGLTIYFLVANFLQCMSAENCKNWLTHVKDISEDKAVFFETPCMCAYILEKFWIRIVNRIANKI